MSRPPERPVFLERDTYRQRRVRDAAFMLPVLGLVLWMIPLLWPRGPEEAGGTANSAVLIYIFAVWAMLIGLAFLLARLLRSDEVPAPPPVLPAVPPAAAEGAADGARTVPGDRGEC